MRARLRSARPRPARFRFACSRLARFRPARHPISLAIALALLAACAPHPTARLAQSPGVAAAPYPDLLPLDALLAGPAPRATADMQAGIESRVAGLRARAARLRGPVIDPVTRNRMRRGVRGAP